MRRTRRAAFVRVGVIAGDAWAAVGTILALLALGMVTLVLSLTRR